MSENVREPAPVSSSRAPVLAPGYTFGSITDKISSIVLRGTPRGWYVGFFIAFAIVMILLFAVTYLFIMGVGIWGIDIPVAWGFAIANFVWWIGIGHAGTLISAILLLLRQQWRTSINRFAEAMTLFAVACAGLFPILHLGRPWFAYWLVPYPTIMGVWPQFRSPLVWDFFAVSTYGTISLVFWYMGLIPDLATLRDRTKRRFARVAYGLLSMGWRGDARHWLRYQKAYFLLAALATPLVVSVHSVVSMDFAVAIVPGWHSTIFPPYFVAGAIYSGFAMVLTIAIPLRHFYKLQDFVTMRHIDNMAKVMLATGMVVAYSYVMEMFMAWYSGSPPEQSQYLFRAFGAYFPWYWALLAFNIVIPQLLWIPRVRTNTVLLFLIAIVINTGMWIERFVIVVVSLSRDFMPSAWGLFNPTLWDVATLLGSIGLFFMLMFLFIRLLPMISIFELRELLHKTEEEKPAPPQKAGVPAD